MSTPTRPMVSTSRRAGSLATRLLLFGLVVPADLVAHLVAEPPPPRLRLGVDPPAQPLQPVRHGLLLAGVEPGADQVAQRPPDVELAGAPQPPVAGAQRGDERAGDPRARVLPHLVVVQQVVDVELVVAGELDHLELAE